MKNEIQYDHRQEKIIMVGNIHPTPLTPDLILSSHQVMEKIQKNIEKNPDNPQSNGIPKGLYIWGGVGIGMFSPHLIVLIISDVE